MGETIVYAQLMDVVGLHPRIPHEELGHRSSKTYKEEYGSEIDLEGKRFPSEDLAILILENFDNKISW